MSCRENKEGEGDRGRLIEVNKVGDVKGLEVCVIRTDIMVKIEQENWKNAGLCSAGLLKLKSETQVSWPILKVLFGFVWGFTL